MGADIRPGEIVPLSKRVDLSKLERAYFADRPNPQDPSERITFGTSGHRGSSLRRTFNEDHIASITAAICDWREGNRVEGPLFLGMDTHALSVPAYRTALEVLGARGVSVLVAPAASYTPTPAVSRAILVHNRGQGPRADGIVITPSHNPPEDGGFKYDPPHGGPAETQITAWIERRANELLVAGGAQSLPRLASGADQRSGRVGEYDFIGHYVDDLAGAIDIEAIRRARPNVGVDPMGGASVEYWSRIAERYGLDLAILNRAIDKTFAFVPADHDGKIRTDCSSPYAMSALLARKAEFDVAVGNDADADRHGIVTRSAGLLPPNHFLCVAIDYLFRRRPRWPASAGIGKTAVTSGMVDRVARALSRRVVETPVGFKWFVSGLSNQGLAFAGEESAGATFLSLDGSPWTTDKDGILLGLLAVEMLSVTGEDPGTRYAALERSFGTSFYARRDTRASESVRERLRRVKAADWTSPTLGGDAVIDRRTTAGAGGDLGGLKVVTEAAWFAARPSGTEDVCKVYAESWRSAEHLEQVLNEAGGLLAESGPES